jgi:sugar phosphate isomerase/epimerase
VPLSDSWIDRFVGSPACIPQWTLEEILPAYATLGFRKFEAFTSWCRSQLDLEGDPHAYREQAARHGIAFTSLHLPPVNDDLDTTIARAVRAARFAEMLGASVVLFKANTRENYVRAAGPFLGALDTEGIRVTPVLQNHAGTAISTLADFREVLEGIADPRMKTLLEVGHFQRVGVPWRDGYDLLAGSIALVHINEIRGTESVPYGTGEVDFPGLFDRLRADGYAGNIVVELELDTRDQDAERTIHYLGEALEYLRTRCGAEAEETS